MASPLLIAHRGYTRHYPENTLIGIGAAIAAGARCVEVDVQLSADELPVLFHDRTLDRLCGVSGAVHDYRYAQLQALRASDFGRFGYRFANTPITRLEELVEMLGGFPAVTAFIELKRISLERFGISTVTSRVLQLLQPVAAQCIVISYDIEALQAVKRQGWRVGAVIDRWREHKQASIQTLQPDILFCDVDGLPRWGRLAFQGAQLAVFETVDPLIAKRLAARGVSHVETFAIGEMLAELAVLEGRA